MTRILGVALLTLAGTTFLAGQDAPKRIDHGKADAKLKGYTTPEGFKLELVPTAALANPTAFAFNYAGVPIVLEPAPGKAETKADAVTITYKDGSTRKIAAARRPGPDTIRVLHGEKWTEAKEFARVADVTAVLAHGEWLYVATPGQVERINALAPEKKGGVIARGFAHVPEGVTGLAVGPDGWLYLAVGAGDHHAEGSDGTRATILGTGAIFRCKPDGSGLHVVARGLARPTAPTWDSLGEAFFADREAKGGRVLHLLDGSDYGYALPTGRSSPVPEALRKELFDPLLSNAPTLVKAAGSAPTAVLAPIEARLPGHVRALVLLADPGRKAVTALSLDREGATFALDKSFDLLTSEDKAFAPTALSVGPDGALYVLDGRSEGRLLRLAWTGDATEEALPPRPLDSWKKLLTASDDDLFVAMATAEASDRRLAGEELGRRGAKGLPGLLKRAADRDEPLLVRLAALQAALPLWDDEVRKLCMTLVGSNEHALRRQSANALGLYAAPRDAAVQAVLLKALVEGEPAVRRALAVAMGRLRADGAVDALANALTFDDGRDPAVRQGLIHAVELLGKPGIDRLIAVADTGVNAELATIVAGFAGLRSRPAADALPKLLQNPHPTARQRATLLRALPRFRFDPPLDLDFVAGHFEAMPDEPDTVKLAALEALTLSPGPAPSAKVTAWLVGLLKEKAAPVRLAALNTMVALKPANATTPLAELLANAERPIEERATALRALAGIDLAEAKKALGGLTAEKRMEVLAELKKQPGGEKAAAELEK